jgi:metal-responsive CopG/Arc/MetJ family transcriptional regulator
MVDEQQKKRKELQTLSVRVPKNLIKALRERADREGYFTPSELLREALRVIFNKEKEGAG